MKKYIKITVSCATRSEIEQICDRLLKEQLIASGDISATQSNYWWNGKIDKEKRYTLTALSVQDKKDKIIELTKKYHQDETPGIVFSYFDANKEFLDWIDQSIN